MRILVIGCHSTRVDRDNIERALFDIVPGGSRGGTEIVFEFEVDAEVKFLHPGGAINLEELNKFDIVIHFCNIFNSIQCQKIGSLLSKEGVLFIDVGRCTELTDYQLKNVKRTVQVIARVEKRYLGKFTFAKQKKE